MYQVEIRASNIETRNFKKFDTLKKFAKKLKTSQTTSVEKDGYEIYHGPANGLYNYVCVAEHYGCWSHSPFTNKEKEFFFV